MVAWEATFIVPKSRVKRTRILARRSLLMLPRITNRIYSVTMSNRRSRTSHSLPQQWLFMLEQSKIDRIGVIHLLLDEILNDQVKSAAG